MTRREETKKAKPEIEHKIEAGIYLYVHENLTLDAPLRREAPSASDQPLTILIDKQGVLCLPSPMRECSLKNEDHFHVPCSLAKEPQKALAYRDMATQLLLKLNG